MASSQVGLNYATAFIDSLHSPDELQKGGQDLEAFHALLRELPSLSRVLEHPGLSLDRRKGILRSALDKLAAGKTSRRLLELVVEKGRLGELRAIIASFNDLRDARLEITSAEVTTAMPLDKAARAEWEAALSRLTGKKVRVTYKADSTLIGGGVTRIGSVVYDGSLKKQLERVRATLLASESD